MRAVVAAALLAASVLTVTACAHKQPPYHRNAADGTACYAYQKAAKTDIGADNVNAIADGMVANPELGDLIVAAIQRYGNHGAPITWCNQHGYPVSLPG